MKDLIIKEIREILRETFEGGLPGQGTQYLDHNAGIFQTLEGLSPQQASFSFQGHPSIAAHVRHMVFHLKVGVEWMQGDHSKRDWVGSFRPFETDEADWQNLKQNLQDTRNAYLSLLEQAPETEFEEEMGYGVVAHLAYHLGAIRQLMHLVPQEVQDI